MAAGGDFTDNGVLEGLAGRAPFLLGWCSVRNPGGKAQPCLVEYKSTLMLRV